MVFLLAVVPYSLYPFYYFCNEMATYSPGYDAKWEALQGNRRNIIFKFRSDGFVHVDKWGQIGLGYVAFLIFGTGTDAHNTYKKMLLAFGLGKVFPSLYVMRESGTSTPSSFISARTWTSSCVSKARRYFYKEGSRISSLGGSTFNNSVRSNSVALDNMDHTHLRSVSSTTPVLPERSSSSTNPSLLKRIFTRSDRHQPILPTFSQHSTVSKIDDEKAVVETVSEGFSARVWASEAPTSRRNSESVGVVVFREVRLDEGVRESTEVKSADEWMLRP